MTRATPADPTITRIPARIATNQIEGVLSPNRSRASLPKVFVGVGVGVCAGVDDGDDVVPPGAFPAPVDGAGRCARCDAGADGAAGTEAGPVGGAGGPIVVQAVEGHGAVGG